MTNRGASPLAPRCPSPLRCAGSRTGTGHVARRRIPNSVPSLALSFREKLHNPPCVQESAYQSTCPWRTRAMDYPTFDRLAHHVGAAGSRRQALRAFLGAALLGALTKNGAATVRGASNGRGRKRCVDEECAPPPGSSISASSAGKAFCCSGTDCSCNGECCNNRCFWDHPTDPTHEFCCTGPEWIMCGGGADAQCCKNVGADSCSQCLAPSRLSGSYRRP